MIVHGTVYIRYMSGRRNIGKMESTQSVSNDLCRMHVIRLVWRVCAVPVVGYVSPSQTGMERWLGFGKANFMVPTLRQPPHILHFAPHSLIWSSTWFWCRKLTSNFGFSDWLPYRHQNGLFRILSPPKHCYSDRSKCTAKKRFILKGTVSKSKESQIGVEMGTHSECADFTECSHFNPAERYSIDSIQSVHIDVLSHFSSQRSDGCPVGICSV